MQEKKQRIVAPGWTRREQWLTAGLLLVSVAFVIEWTHHRVEQVSQTNASAAVTIASASDVTDADSAPLDPLSDEADAGQARSIHVPGQDHVDTNAVETKKASAKEAERQQAAARAAAARKEAEKKKQNALLTQEQIDSTLKAIEAMEWSPATERKLTDFVRLWSKQDPIAAMEYALGIESNKARTAVMKSVFGDWMKRDPGSARAWFNSMLAVDPLGVDAVAGMVYRDRAGTDTAGVLAEIAKLPGNSLKRSALSSVVSQLLAQNNLNALFTIHDNMAPGLDRDLLTEAILRGAGIYEPTEIGAWALSQKDAHSRQLALDGLVKTWSADQPVSAAEWVTTLQDEAERSRSIAAVAQSWAREDAVATGDWLLSLNPPSPSLDPALGNFVKAVMKENPSGAMSWAGTVSDAKQRNSLLTQVGKQWIKSDRDAAMAFLNETPLPDSVLKAILAADPGATAN